MIVHLTVYGSTPTLRATTTIRNDSDQKLIVTQVTSLVLGGLTTGSTEWWDEYTLPGEEFTTVPLALVHVYDDYEKAFSALTRYRRIIRRKHEDNSRLPIIFNDYMNCLMGDPTEEKILALVDPVIKAGAEYFVCPQRHISSASPQ